jgi:murein DD-endopeptidase MepM/ murein hydrolase activator NlpD
MPRQETGQRIADSHERLHARVGAPRLGQARPRATAPRPGRPANRSTASPFLQAAFAAVAVLILGGSIGGFVLASGSPGSVVPTADVVTTGADAGVGGVSTYGLPFATGTSMNIAQGPHADNYKSVPGYKFTGAGDVPAVAVAASLDLGAPQNTAVRPVASGRVIASWPDCNVVIVDHGGGVWAEYVHIQVAVAKDQTVGRDSVLGTLLGAYDHSGTNCGDHSTGPHLHLAFISGSGTSGTYVPIAGRVLCGRTVDGAGNLAGLGTVRGSNFIVPNCEATGQPVVTPTPKPVVTPTPKPVVTPTPKPVVTPPPAPVVTPAPPANAPVGSCDAPSLGGPAADSSLGSTQDVSLSWATNCSQTYAELSGGPYATLSFGGWQAASGVHIGQMWPGTYTWHVKGKSASGQETSWSASRSFTVQSAAAPIVTNPPAPIITNPPAPIVTNPPAPIITNPPAPRVPDPPAPVVTPSPTPCPFKDGGNGVTFYTGANFTGQSWTWYVPAGNGDAYADLPSGLYRNLGSFYVSNNAWHVVLYQGENGTGNLGHYDASWANVDSYWHVTESVKIYINRTSC